MQEARAAGCRTASEAKKFLEGKKGKETEEKDTFHMLKCRSLDDWDISGFPGEDLLSESVSIIPSTSCFLSSMPLLLILLSETQRLHGGINVGPKRVHDII